MPRGWTTIAAMTGALWSAAATGGDDRIVLQAPSQRVPGDARTPRSPDHTSGPRLVIDSTLRAIPVATLDLAAGAWRFADEGGKPGTLPRTNVLAVMPAPAAEPAARAGGLVWRSASSGSEGVGRLELVDGQVLAGKLTGMNADQFEWEHPLLGRLAVPLDRVALLVPKSRGSADTIPPSASDTLLLQNGDRLSGFVAGLAPAGAEGLAIDFEVGGKKQRIPLSRVAAVRLSNPAAASVGPRVWLRDGSVVSGDLSPGTGKGPRVTPAGITPSEGKPHGAIDLRWGDLLGYAADTSRVRALASIPWTRVLESADRTWTPGPRIDASTRAALGALPIDLPGPMGVEWELPAGATRLAGTAVLPPACRTFGSCTLTIEVAGLDRPLHTATLTGASPRAEFNVALPPTSGPTGPTLRLRLEPGTSGPVQARATLEHTLILVK